MTDTTTQLDIPGLDGELSTTQLRMLSRGLSILKSLPVEFIVVGGGETYTQGELELVAKKSAKQGKRPLKYPFGAIRKHVTPYMQDMKPGDVVQVPIGEYDINSIQSGVCNYAGRTWGNDTYTTARIGSKGVIEVMRVV